jgi:hypothetical protein
MRTSQTLCSPLVTPAHPQYQTAGCKAITSKEGPELGYIIVYFVVRKTSLELERAILTTLYFAGAENTDSWSAIKKEM